MRAPLGGRSLAVALALTLALTLGVVASASGGCAGTQPTSEWQARFQKHNEITALWTQVRDWRREARMGLEPAPNLLQSVRGTSVGDAARVCPVSHAVPTACNDVCSLADAICDNAEAICGIADELGKDDDFAQQKCASAKASCREAKQRCCGCSEEP